MGLPSLLAAFGLSILPAALSRLDAAGLAFDRSSYLALALAPWAVLAGIPRRPRARPAGALASAALASPMLALSARLDALRGAPAFDLVLALASGLATVALLSWAGQRAASSRSWGLLWLALVLLPGALRGALALGRPGAQVPGLDFAAPLTSLGWSLERAPLESWTPALGGWSSAGVSSLGPLACSALLALAAARCPGGEAAGKEGAG